MLKTPNTFDYVIVGIYFFVMIMCGFILARVNKNDKDYFKASGKIPWPMASLSLFIGSFSAYMFVAAAGQVYKAGIAAFLIYMSNAGGFLFLALYLAKFYRRTRITSPMEVVEMRFDKVTKTVMTYLQIPILMIGTGNLLYVLCIFLSSILGLKESFEIFGFTVSGLHASMIFTGIIIVIYTAIGGLWAVIVTDSVQFIVVMVASVFLTVISIMRFTDLGGGSFVSSFQSYMANPPHEGFFHFANEYQPFMFTFAWILLMGLSQPGNLPIIQRCACVPNEKAAQKCCWLALVFFIVCPVVWIFPVFILRQHLPDLAALWPHIKNPAEASYVTLALQLLPNGMIGLVTSAILAASISSMASCFNMISIVFTNDIYAKIFPKHTGDKQMILIGRLASVAVGVCSVTIGILLSGFADAFKTTFTIASHTGLALALPLVLGLVFKRTPWWTGIVAMISCFATTISLEFLIPAMAEKTDSQFWTTLHAHMFESKIFGAILVNLLVSTISGLFYKPSNASRRLNEMLGLIQKPIGEDEQDKMILVSDLRAYRVVGFCLMFFAVPLLLAKFLGFAEDAKYINLYAGLAFLGLAVLVFWFTDKKYSIFKVVRQQGKLVHND